jgi:hypothetical protein
MMFETFWALYPRKVSKRVAQRKFEILTKAEQKQALEALPNHIKYWKTRNTEMEFIPHASTWIGQYRFEDEIVIEEKKKPVIPWHTTNELVMKKAQEVGITPYAGEDWGQLKSRIYKRILELEGQL